MNCSITPQKTFVMLSKELEIFIKDASELLEILDDNFNELSPAILICETSNLSIFSHEEHFRAAQSTLQSIFHCCKAESFADAHMLIRKYRDDLFQAIYFFTQIGIYTELLITKAPIPTELNNEIEIIKYWYNCPALEEQKESNPKHYKQICYNRRHVLDAHHYKETLLEKEIVSELCSRFFKETWKSINDLANNYTHSNTLTAIKDNIPNASNSIITTYNLSKALKQLQLVTIYAICILFLTNSYQFRSSDYIDYLDMGETPPEGSQYWIPPVIQDFFDKYLTLVNPQLKDYLKDKNIYCMHID